MLKLAKLFTSIGKTKETEQERTIENEDILAIQRGMLKLSGVWPYKEVTVLNVTKTIISWLSSIILFVTISMHMYINLYEGIDRLSIIIFSLTHYTVILFKLANYLFKRKRILNMLEDLKHPDLEAKTSEEIECLRSDKEQIKTLSKFFIRLGFAADALLLVSALTQGGVPNDVKLETKYPFDINRYFYLIFALDTVTITILTWNILAMDASVAAFMSVGHAQIKILINNIQNVRERALKIMQNDYASNQKFADFPNDDVDKIVVKLLAKEIRRHNAIIRYVANIESTLSLIMMGQFVETVITICICIYQMIIISPFTFTTIYLISLLLQIFLYCYYGHRLIFQSHLILDACYKMDWTNSGSTVRKSLFIIMERSKRFMVVRVFRLFPLSLQTFTMILKTSYSVYTVLQSIQK